MRGAIYAKHHFIYRDTRSNQTFLRKRGEEVVESDMTFKDAGKERAPRRGADFLDRKKNGTAAANFASIDKVDVFLRPLFLYV